jgi:hypothetical protein
MRADVFYRKFNSRRESIGEVLVEVPQGAELELIIREAGRLLGKALERRSSSTGVFEVQTDEGIWSVPEGSLTRWQAARERLVVREGAVFESWEELERREP